MIEELIYVDIYSQQKNFIDYRLVIMMPVISL